MHKVDSIKREFDLIVESIKHLAGVERVECFENHLRPGVYRAHVFCRNRKIISILIQNKGNIQPFSDWQKIGSKHDGI